MTNKEYEAKIESLESTIERVKLAVKESGYDCPPPIKGKCPQQDICAETCYQCWIDWALGGSMRLIPMSKPFKSKSEAIDWGNAMHPCLSKRGSSVVAILRTWGWVVYRSLTREDCETQTMARYKPTFYMLSVERFFETEIIESKDYNYIKIRGVK